MQARLCLTCASSLRKYSTSGGITVAPVMKAERKGV